MSKRSLFLVLTGLAALGPASLAAQQRSDVTPVPSGSTGGRFTVGGQGQHQHPGARSIDGERRRGVRSDVQRGGDREQREERVHIRLYTQNQASVQ